MKSFLVAVFCLFSCSAYAQPVCRSSAAITDALFKAHMYPVWAGALEGGGMILFRSKEGKWAIVTAEGDIACIQASGPASKFAEKV